MARVKVHSLRVLWPTVTMRLPSFSFLFHARGGKKEEKKKEEENRSKRKMSSGFMSQTLVVRFILQSLLICHKHERVIIMHFL